MSKALLVVSFGTSYAETRKKTIEALEGTLAAAFPERKAYRAWTSSIIRKKLLRTEGMQIDSVEEAVDIARDLGYPCVLRPASTMGGTGGGMQQNIGLGQMMAMSMFMGGKDNPFDGMFDFSFDGISDEEEDEDNKPETKEEE